MKKITATQFEVKALLAGATTIIRLVKQQPEYLWYASPTSVHRNEPTNWGTPDHNGEWHTLAVGGDSSCDETCVIQCPFGRIGDEVAIKESYARRDDFDWKADREKTLHYLHYKASYNGDLGMEWHYYGKWRSASTMASWMCRVHKVVDHISVKQLQHISNIDFNWAGIPSYKYADLLDSIYDKETWDANPWCWVVKLKELENEF